MKKLLIILLFIYGVANINGTTRIYPVFPKEGEIIIDGKIAEKAWDGAPWAGEFLQPQKLYYVDGTKGKELQKTKFKMLYDQEGVYLGIIAEESFIKKMKMTKKDGEKTYTEDCIEIFLMPVGEKKYFRVGINAKGQKSDLRIKSAATINDDSYIIETKIPYAVFGELETTLKKLLGNVCRSSFAANEFSSWASLFAHYHEPANFVEFTFQKKPVSTEQIKSIETFVNVICSSKLVGQAKNMKNKYEKLLEKVTKYGVKEKKSKAVVTDWKNQKKQAETYITFFEYFNEKRNKSNFWTKDHSIITSQGPCPKLFKEKNQLNTDEKNVVYHCLMMELLKD